MGQIFLSVYEKCLIYTAVFSSKGKRKRRGEIQMNSLYSKEYHMCDPLLHKPENSIDPTNKYR
jgi:hypothetical protein